ncbi:hypothetical protein, partial [Mesorhizobium sp. M8A.F.Ca.ET.213.01.1.1]|uniref:hypothetical protein n=1 Tax=Mesorhizobium sp. M8A.F.Ca.ET.213.01.1.1 TaxID=2563970 RepID=UPI001AED2E6A
KISKVASSNCPQSLAHKQENATPFVEHSFKIAGQKSVIRAKFDASGNRPHKKKGSRMEVERT